MKFNFISKSEEDTISLAQKLIKVVKTGDVFALYGTLGMGKSVFSRAMIQSLLGDIDVPSPTFTLLQFYEAENFDIYHFDLYRLKSPEEVFEIGLEDAVYSGVSLIEWPENAGGYLPRDVFKVTIEPSEYGRSISIDTDNLEKINRLKKVFND